MINLLSARDRRKKTLFTFIVDRGWRKSRLPSLARVLLCLFRVGVPHKCLQQSGIWTSFDGELCKDIEKNAQDLAVTVVLILL